MKTHTTEKKHKTHKMLTRSVHLSIESSIQVACLRDCACTKVLEGDTGRVSPTQRMSLLTGTFAYRAPELLRGECPDTKADIYSFGITLWQMESRQTPYDGHEPHAVVFNVVAYNARPTVCNSTNKHIANSSYFSRVKDTLGHTSSPNSSLSRGGEGGPLRVTPSRG